MSKVAATLVTCPGYAITVSFQPASVGTAGSDFSANIAVVVLKRMRLMTRNLTKWMWIGWESSDQFQNSQISVVSFLGFVTMGSFHKVLLKSTLLPLIPKSTALGPKGFETTVLALLPFSRHVPGSSGFGSASGSQTMAPSASVVEHISSESSSRSARSRRSVTTAGCLHTRFAGSFASGSLSFRCSGGVASLPTFVSCTTWNSITWRVVFSSAMPTLGSKPPKGSSGPVLMSRTTVPFLRPRKSTSTSARSEGPMSRASRGEEAGRLCLGMKPLPGSAVLKPVRTSTTFGSKLCSAPIW
mmetsp:Transcript_65179/g.164266  ORF Transcript_65179/g.164266 Transcript_65179/m.164266 type:complete len:300 (+) Transcript_65179:168-1067(+)